MPRPDRGSAWLVDLGMTAKVRPCLMLSVPTCFLRGAGVFDAQQIVTVSQIKLIRKLGDLKPDQLRLVETAVRTWLGL